MNNTKSISFDTNKINKYVKTKRKFLEFSSKELYEYKCYSNHIFYETYSITDELNIVISAFDKTVLEKFGTSIPTGTNTENQIIRAEKFESFLIRIFQLVKKYNSLFIDDDNIVTPAQKALIYELYRSEIGSFCKFYKRRRIADNTVFSIDGDKFRFLDKKIQDLHSMGLAFKFRNFRNTRQELQIILMCIDKFKGLYSYRSEEYKIIDNEVKEENQKFFKIDKINKITNDVKGATCSRLQRAILQIHLTKKYKLSK